MSLAQSLALHCPPTLRPDSPPFQIQKRRFGDELHHHSLVHEQLIQFYRGFKHDAHPMAIMVGWGGVHGRAAGGWWGSLVYDYSDNMHRP